MFTLEKAKVETRLTSFPAIDIRPEHTSLLSVVMSDPTILGPEHAEAERNFPAFEKTHGVLTAVAQQFYPFHASTPALSHGVTVLEALHNYVSSARTHKGFVVDPNLGKLQKWLDEDAHDSEVRAFFSSAVAEFTHKLPETAEIVREASVRKYGGDASYAVIGAAWSYKIRNDAIK